MYTKRIQIINYGPLAELDIEFPFDGEVPKPVVLVGGNGSGKSILLSNIVNGLVSAQCRAYPGTPEVETGQVFKIRSGYYIRSGSQSAFARVDFEDGLFASEMMLSLQKSEYEIMPPELGGEDAKVTWGQMKAWQQDSFASSISQTDQNKLWEIFSKNCVLYFPPNRFEEPAWLNEGNLNAHAELIVPIRLQGSTTRRIINYSALKETQNWLFGLLFDRAVFETRAVSVPMPVQDGGQSVPLPIQVGPSGEATSVYEIALQVVRLIMKGELGARFGIGHRLNRVVSLEGVNGNIVPNIFQLSSGETSLLNLFLSILRDFDLSDESLTNAADIRGIVVVDEIDLHLHAVYQHEVLPVLMQMFPKVQFVVTTHSPLFVLGMTQTFGEDGFALYRMPQGQQISPEEFTEFGDAYRAFTATSKFSDDIRLAVRHAQSPILYMEGKTDVQYLRKAAELLGKDKILEGVEIEDGEGAGNLTKAWRALVALSENLVPRKVVLLFDCDYRGASATKGNRVKCKNPLQTGHPIKKGIENLLSQVTLDKARAANEAFINVTPEHPTTVRGEHQTVPETWEVNQDEKPNLCNWICDNGTVEDFRHFQVIFDLLEEALGDSKDESCNSA